MGAVPAAQDINVHQGKRSFVLTKRENRKNRQIRKDGPRIIQAED